jgi:hypothetical protein
VLGRSAVETVVLVRIIVTCMTGIATGMPAEVRIMATSVGENSKFEVAFADANLAATRLGSGVDKPRSILVERRGAVDVEGGGGGGSFLPDSGE